jgi:hypothetical protein
MQGILFFGVGVRSTEPVYRKLITCELQDVGSAAKNKTAQDE